MSVFVLQAIFPKELVFMIKTYLPREKKKKKECSPSLQKELQRIQTVSLRGKSAMYMRDFEDFCLD
jgi:hypothetical protein